MNVKDSQISNNTEYDFTLNVFSQEWFEAGWAKYGSNKKFTTAMKDLNIIKQTDYFNSLDGKVDPILGH